MSKLLVTTDLSPNSKSAVKFAVQLAEKTNSKLIFYLVVEGTRPAKRSAAEQKLNEREEYNKHCLMIKKFVEKTIGSEVRNANYMVGIGNNVAKTIIDAAKENKADFICMGTHGAGNVEKMFGTNASKIITTSPTPVIVVPKGYRVSPIKKLFFACDFAALNKEMKIVQKVADELKAEVNVFHFDYMIELPGNLKKLEKKSEKFATKNTRFHFRKLNIETSLSEHVSIEVRKEKPSLVVLFTKQDRKWFDRLFLKSEAAELSFHSNVPLLTFRKSL